MNKDEFVDTIKHNSLSWNSRFKWFGTFDFVTQRVLDGKFNNSNFKTDRYKYLLEFDFDDDKMNAFSKCGYNEFMLERKKSPLVKIKSIKEIK